MSRGIAIALVMAFGALPVTAHEPVAHVSVRKGTPLRDAFRAVSDGAGMNFVVDPSAREAVGGNAAVEIEAATWAAALDALVKAHGLEAEVTGNVIRVVGPSDPCPGSGLMKETSGFSGRPLSLDFKDGVTIDMLRFISEFAGLGIVLDADAPGLRTRNRLNLTEVPWDQALDLVLREACLTAVIDGKVVRVSQAQPPRSL